MDCKVLTRRAHTYNYRVSVLCSFRPTTVNRQPSTFLSNELIGRPVYCHERQPH
jgi:hypothetical protein